MKICLSILFTLLLLSAGSQTKKTQALISELNDRQFIIDHQNRSTFHFNSKAANKLIRKGTKVSKELFTALSDTGKVIMAQLILCNIYFKKATFAGPKMVTENDEHVNKYFLGEENGEGLIISEIRKNGTYYLFIRPADLEKTKEFWKKKLNL